MSYIGRIESGSRGWLFRRVTRARANRQWERVSKALDSMIERAASEAEFIRSLPEGYALDDGGILRRRVEIKQLGAYVGTVWTVERLEVC